MIIEVVRDQIRNLIEQHRSTVALGDASQVAPSLASNSALSYAHSIKLPMRDQTAGRTKIPTSQSLRAPRLVYSSSTAEIEAPHPE